MSKTVWDYFEERKQECERLSLVSDPEAEFYAEEEGSGGKRGRLMLMLDLSEHAVLAVSELVVVENNHIHREEYAYFLIVKGQEYWARERDPSHDPPEHGHGPGHAYVEAGRVTFRGAVETAWAILSEEEWLSPD